MGKSFPASPSILFPGTTAQAIITPEGKTVPYPD
jgi:hypothetical protein